MYEPLSLERTERSRPYQLMPTHADGISISAAVAAFLDSVPSEPGAFVWDLSSDGVLVSDARDSEDAVTRSAAALLLARPSGTTVTELRSTLQLTYGDLPLLVFLFTRVRLICCACSVFGARTLVFAPAGAGLPILAFCRHACDHYSRSLSEAVSGAAFFGSVLKSTPAARAAYRSWLLLHHGSRVLTLATGVCDLRSEVPRGAACRPACDAASGYTRLYEFGFT
jgi:hypothetical protein